MARKPVPRKTLKDLEKFTNEAENESHPVTVQTSQSKVDRSKAFSLFNAAEKKPDRKLGYTFSLANDTHQALEEASKLLDRPKSEIVEKLIQDNLM